jgi:tetratricopeptide (TPR) repeat protein
MNGCRFLKRSLPIVLFKSLTLVSPNLLAIVLLLPLWSACRVEPSTEEAKRLLVEGKLVGACEVWSDLLRQDEPLHASQKIEPRDAWLEHIRGFILCSSLIGTLDRAAARLAQMPLDAPRLYGEALIAVARPLSQLPLALSLLARAESLWPDRGEIPYRAGVLLLADEQPRRAIPFLERAFRLSETASCAAALAHALLDLDRGAEALDHARKIPSLYPSAEDISRGRALIARLVHRSTVIPDKARARYEHALDLLQKRDRPGEAITLSEDLLHDFPRFGACYTVLGLAHLRLNNGPETYVSFERAMDLSPLNAENPLYLALFYQLRGHLEESVTYFRRALALNPFLDRAAYELGKTLLKLNRKKEARLALEQSLAVEGDGDDVLRLVAKTHLSIGSYDGAEAHLERLVKKYPNDFELQILLAQTLLKHYLEQQKRASRLLLRAKECARQASALQSADPALKELKAQLDALE